MASGPWLSAEVAVALKIGIALATAVWIGVDAALRRSGRDAFLRRARDAALVVLGIAGALGWWWFGAAKPWDVHAHDSFHYYVGAKYFPELSYTRLYRCAAEADLAAGVGPPAERRLLRDLATNRQVRAAAALADPAGCRAHFSDARWSEFERDLAFFRAQLPRERWLLTQTDHGFNGTPVWLIAGHALASAVEPSARSIAALSLIDTLLLAGAWAAALASFGWRGALAPLVFFGANAFNAFAWTGGAFLRYDWLAATLASLCLLRRGRPLAAGFCLGLAALLRVFPALAALGLAAAAARDCARRRSVRLAPAHARFALGALLALCLLVPLAAATQGVRAWGDFARNARLDASTPLRNHVGLAALVAFDSERRASRLLQPGADDPYAGWKRAQQRALERRAGLLAAAVLAYLALLLRGVRGLPDWAALALGTGAIPVLVPLTAYYEAVLLGVGFLALRRPEIGAAWCLLAALSWLAAPRFGESDLDQLAASALLLAAVLFATLRARGAAAAPPGVAAPRALPEDGGRCAPSW